MHVMCTLYYSPPSFLDCLRADSLMSSWSGVSYARITSSCLFTGVTNWEAWKRKWALCSSLSLSLCDLLQDNSFSESAFLHSVSASCLSFSNCKISNRCLFDLVSLAVPFVPLAFILPLSDFFLGPSRAKRVSSPSNCIGNWGDTYKKELIKLYEAYSRKSAGERLMRICHWMGSHFHNRSAWGCIFNRVSTCRMGSHFFKINLGSRKILVSWDWKMGRLLVKKVTKSIKLHCYNCENYQDLTKSDYDRVYNSGHRRSDNGVNIQKKLNQVPPPGEEIRAPLKLTSSPVQNMWT